MYARDTSAERVVLRAMRATEEAYQIYRMIVCRDWPPCVTRDKELAVVDANLEKVRQPLLWLLRRLVSDAYTPTDENISEPTCENICANELSEMTPDERAIHSGLTDAMHLSAADLAGMR